MVLMEYCLIVPDGRSALSATRNKRVCTATQAAQGPCEVKIR